jgi:hypothetical protein
VQRGLVAVFLLSLVACGGAPAASSHDLATAPDLGPVDLSPTPGQLCDDPRADPWRLPITKPTLSGAWIVSLTASETSPPLIGTDTWTLRITDPQGAPANVTMTIRPWMPDHGHGTSVIPMSTPEGGGVYRITPLYFFMPGLWQTTFTMTEDSLTDAVVFSVCLEDA